MSARGRTCPSLSGVHERAHGGVCRDGLGRARTQGSIVGCGPARAERAKREGWLAHDEAMTSDAGLRRVARGRTRGRVPSGSKHRCSTSGLALALRCAMPRRRVLPAGLVYASARAATAALTVVGRVRGLGSCLRLRRDRGVAMAGRVEGRERWRPRCVA